MRVREQGERDSQPLLHAHGETARTLDAHVAESHFGKYFVDALLGQAEERRADAQVLPRREIGVERCLFDERANAVEVVALPRVAVDEDLPCRGAKHSADHLECRGLARAVWPEEAVHFALFDVKVHIGHGCLGVVAAAELFGEPACFEHERHGGPFYSRPAS